MKFFSSVKRALCYIPGIGTPISVYYFLTSAEHRSAAGKGLLLLPVSVLFLSLSASIKIPSVLLLLAGAYIYWGIIASVASSGFLGMLLVYRALTGDIVVPKLQLKPTAVPVSDTLQVSVPSGSDATFAELILKEIERLPRERREVIFQKISDSHE